MKRIHSLTASAIAMMWSLTPAPAAPKLQNQSLSNEPQMILEQIDTSAAAISETAFRLGAFAMRRQDPQSHLDGLAALREDINTVGSELRSLEAERGSLTEWEATAFDQILPLMQDAADNAEKAIQTFNSDRQRLWATSYVADTAAVSKDANEVATLLGTYLKLAKTREKEYRLEQSLEATH